MLHSMLQYVRFLWIAVVLVLVVFMVIRAIRKPK